MGTTKTTKATHRVSFVFKHNELHDRSIPYEIKCCLDELSNQTVCGHSHFKNILDILFITEKTVITTQSIFNQTSDLTLAFGRENPLTLFNT